MKANNYFRYLLLGLMLTVGLTAAAQKEQRAKEILDKASATLAADSGIRATFLLKNYRQGRSSGETKGTIALKGNRFVLETPGTTTWFNGQTQWTYVSENEEINVSTPTEEELQSINPYSFINLYKKGFNYQLAEAPLYKGKKVYKVVLVPENKRQDITQIELLIEQAGYQPAYIRVCAQKGEEMTVEILSYQRQQHLPDSYFTLDAKKYPQAEIIDLR